MDQVLGAFGEPDIGLPGEGFEVRGEVGAGAEGRDVDAAGSLAVDRSGATRRVATAGPSRAGPSGFGHFGPAAFSLSRIAACWPIYTSRGSKQSAGHSRGVPEGRWSAERGLAG